MNEGAFAIFRCRRFGLFFAEQFDIASQRHGGEQVLGFSNLAAHQLGTEAKRKFQDFYANPASREKMAELVERDENPYHEEEPSGFLHQQPEGVGGPGEGGGHRHDLLLKVPEFTLTSIGRNSKSNSSAR